MKPAILRTVRRLDERSETREVNGFVVESDVPMPPKKNRPGDVLEVVAALQLGDSFVHTHACKDSRDNVRRRFPDRSFASREIGPKKHRIWRIK